MPASAASIRPRALAAAAVIFCVRRTIAAAAVNSRSCDHEGGGRWNEVVRVRGSLKHFCKKFERCNDWQAAPPPPPS